MLNTPFSPWPSFTNEEAAAVQRVLLSNKVNYWTGNESREFEKEFATWCGAKHAVALANGTLALDLALKVLGIGPGDEVIVTPRTFLASVSCVVNAGAKPIFADVDFNSQNITADTIRAVISSKTKAIICVHLAGWPCDMDPIMDLARAHDLYVIEDCAQAHGAKYKGRSVGAIGDIGAWSFCQDKIITTGGEGGMLTTNNSTWWSRAWSFKDHGKSWNAIYEANHQPGFRWVHHSFGTNWRMTEMQAVIGRLQLRKMSEWNAARNQNAALLREALDQFSGPDGLVRLPPSSCASCHFKSDQSCSKKCVHAYYKFYIFLNLKKLAPEWSRDKVIDEINSQGVPCLHGSCSEVYLERAFDNTGLRPTTRLPNAHELGESSVMFLVHPTLTEFEIRKTASVVVQVLERASR